ncbi:sugar dehydrogenase complex small subunit [soil metagenome]
MSSALNELQDEPGLSIARRTLLAGAAVAGAAIALGGLGVLGSPTAEAAAAAPAATADFLSLSQLLTGGKPLSADLAGRYAAALGRHDAKFGESLAAPQSCVGAANVAGIDELIALPGLSEPLRNTITQIVSAWYLGIVGEDVDAELISYEQALMYRPTQDVLVIPTYGGGPGSWGEKPAYLAAQSTGKSS